MPPIATSSVPGVLRRRRVAMRSALLPVARAALPALRLPRLRALLVHGPGRDLLRPIDRAALLELALLDVLVLALALRRPGLPRHRGSPPGADSGEHPRKPAAGATSRLSTASHGPINVGRPVRVGRRVRRAPIRPLQVGASVTPRRLQARPAHVVVATRSRSPRSRRVVPLQRGCNDSGGAGEGRWMRRASPCVRLSSGRAEDDHEGPASRSEYSPPRGGSG